MNIKTRTATIMKILIPIALALGTVALALSLIVQMPPSGAIKENDVTQITTWRSSQTGLIVETPGNIPQLPDGTASITAFLPEGLDETSALFIADNYQIIRVTVGNHVLIDPRYQKSMAGCGDQIDGCSLSPELSGKQITIQFLGGGSKDRIELYNVYVGPLNSIRYTLALQSIPWIIVFFMMLTIVVVLSIASVMERTGATKAEVVGYFPLSLFILLASCWILEDSPMQGIWFLESQFHLILNIVSYLSFPIPLLIYIQKSYSIKSGFLKIIQIFSISFFIINALLIIVDHYNLSTALTVSHLILALLFTSLLCICLVEYRKTKNSDLVWLISGLVFIGLTAIIQAILFYSWDSQRSNTSAFAIGLIGFILILFLNSLQKGLRSIPKTKTFSELTYSVPCGICKLRMDEAFTITYANQFFYSQFGYDESEAAKVGFSSFFFNVFPKDLPTLKNELDKMISSKLNSYQCEHRFFRKDGSIVWILSRFNYDFEHPENGVTSVLFNVDDRRKMEEQQRVKEEEYRIATEHSNKFIMRYNLDTGVAYLQKSAADLMGLGIQIPNVPESILSSGIVANESIDAVRQFFNEMKESRRSGSTQISFRVKNTGEFRWYQNNFTTIFDEDGYPLQAIISFYDITAQHQKELAFERWQQTYDDLPKQQMNYYEFDLTEDFLEQQEGSMFPALPDFVRGGISKCMQFIADLYVYPEDKSMFISFFNSDRILSAYLRSKKADRISFRRMGPESQQLWTSASIQIVPDPYSTVIKCFVLFKDIDKQKRAELLLMEKSTYDSQTGILRREAFIESFSSRIKNYSNDATHVFIIADIDDFKKYNDSLGHQAGDEVLKAFARRMKSELREDDICGRLGGDEFLICLFNSKIGSTLKTRLQSLLESSVFEFHGMKVTCSIGAAIYPIDGTSFDELYQKADNALYYAKEHQKGTYKITNS